MASGGRSSNAGHSGVVTHVDPASGHSYVVTNARQATLRLSVQKIQGEMTTKFEQQLQNARREIENIDDEDELLAYVDNKFDFMNAEFNRQSDELRNNVKAKVPKKPKRSDYSSDEAYTEASTHYDQEVTDFKQFVEYATAIIARLTEFIKNLFSKIKEFFTSLWQWIKSKFEKITEKVKDFIEFMKKKFAGLVDYIFG